MLELCEENDIKDLYLCTLFTILTNFCLQNWLLFFLQIDRQLCELTTDIRMDPLMA